jgi:hypothetical protein
MKFKPLATFTLFNQRILLALLACSVALVINILVYLIPPPVSITRVISNFNPWLAFLLIIFLGTVFSGKGIVWDAISLTLALVLFSLPIISKWQVALNNGYLIGGLLPWSDAHDYYEGAYHLINNGVLTAWATRRPLFGGFLAVILSVTRNNLQITQVLLAIFNGLASFLASREIQKSFGPFSAATFLLICYWFYVRYAGLTLSEQLGLCFGSLAVAFLARGVQNESIKETTFGLFLLTIALNARAGAFFILPALILWLEIYYAKRIGRLKLVLFAIVVVALGMLTNFFMVKMIGPSTAAPFSNYSYTLYGLASGNQGWAQVMKDYPDVKEEDVLNLAIQKIREEPLLFIVGVFRSYQDYFSLFRGQFSFMHTIQDQNDYGNRLLWVFTWTGLVSAVFNRRDELYGLALATFLGVFLSAGLLPPVDADYVRIYAATIPIVAYIASMGVALLAQHPRDTDASDRILINGWMSPNLLLPFSIMLLVASFAGPLLIKISVRHSKNTSSILSCPYGEKEIIFLTTSATSIRLVDSQGVTESYLPRIKVDDFKSSIKSGSTLYPFLNEALLGLERNQVITIGTYQGINSAEFQTSFLITHGEMLKPGLQHICVLPSQDNRLKDYAFFYYESGANGVRQALPAMLLQNPTLVNIVRDLYILSCVLLYLISILSHCGFWPPLLDKRLFTLLGGFIFLTALIFSGMLIYLHSNAIYPLAWERKSLEMKDALHRGAHLYELPLGTEWMDRRLMGNSPAIIYEDGQPLGFPNANRSDIKSLGGGRYSIERETLFFSSSDNSNPRTNNRHYELYWPTPISPTLQRLSYALTVISMLLLLLLLYKFRSLG